MELQASKNLVEKVFNNSYSRNNFLDLISNLLKSYNKDQKEMIISDNKNQFNSFVYLGSYEESNKELGIYEVEIDNLKTLLNYISMSKKDGLQFLLYEEINMKPLHGKV